MEVLKKERYFSTAIIIAHNLLVEDNLTESVYGQLMLFYYYRNDRSSAIRIYDLCCQTQEMDIRVNPGSELQKIYWEIVGEDSFKVDVSDHAILKIKKMSNWNSLIFKTFLRLPSVRIPYIAIRTVQN